MAKDIIHLGEIWREKETGIAGYVTGFDQYYDYEDLLWQTNSPHALVSLSLYSTDVAYSGHIRSSNGHRPQDLEFVRIPSYFEREHFNNANTFHIPFPLYCDKFLQAYCQSSIGDEHVMRYGTNTDEGFDTLRILDIDGQIRLRYDVPGYANTKDGRHYNSVSITLPKIIYCDNAGRTIYNHHPNPNFRRFCEADKNFLVFRDNQARPVGVEALTHAKHYSALGGHLTGQLLVEYPNLIGATTHQSDTVELFYYGSENSNIALGQN